MRTISYLISFLLLAACTGTPSKAPLTLWYDKPAQNWDEALPIGNGRAGAMVFGGVEKEQLQLNENTLYSGEPSVVFKDVKNNTGDVRQSCRADESRKIQDSFRPGLQELAGTPAPILPTVRRPAYPKQQAGDAAGYKRALNISDAVATTVYKQNGVKYERGSIRFPSGQRDRHASEKRYTEWHRHLARFHITSSDSPAKGTDDRLILHGQAPGYVERRTFEQIEQWGDQYKHPELYDANGKRKFDKRMLYGDEIGGKGMFSKPS